MSIEEDAVMVVLPPFPVKEYQTPSPPTQEPGAVSETVPTVVPAKLLVAQGKLVAFAHKSLAGAGTETTMVALLEFVGQDAEVTTHL